MKKGLKETTQNKCSVVVFGKFEPGYQYMCKYTFYIGNAVISTHGLFTLGDIDNSIAKRMKDISLSIDKDHNKISKIEISSTTSKWEVHSYHIPSIYFKNIKYVES